MKTPDELYTEALKNEELKKAFLDAIQTDKVAEFLASNDCNATVEEAKTFLISKQNMELSDDELDQVSGGRKCGTVYSDGWPVVTHLNSCDYYKSRAYARGEAKYRKSGSGMCEDCNYFGTDGWLYLCYCAYRRNN